ncbi:DUF6248 family natural product biosynthesis protein [Actinoplanes palleronii]|uniref:Uncharacterized protein n=1 Tax=Actinoplanes palleronii TaxID=113570 RepID=A0ABQ4BJA8_9ACTN|nr:DUF6248 family natural product biosynthesis protein [Actinoplanes palleronii]GIE70759.1 hypothetical protein Apa02nite_068670 [Actinoplanes palleronii]
MNLSPRDLLALRAYAAGRRADLTATELGAARNVLAAAGLVRDCTHRTSPMYVTATPAGCRLLVELDRGALAPMTEDAADWIYREVLTQTYRRSVGAEARGKGQDDLQLGPAAVRRCRCQYGRCGHCGTDRHEQCTTHVHGARRGGETYVVGRTGGALAEVWLSGKACAWRCSCGCPAPVPVQAIPEPEPEPVFEQMDLFALAAGAS